MSERNAKARNFMGTYHLTHSEEEDERWLAYFSDEFEFRKPTVVSYAIFGFEFGELGTTPHIQYAIGFNNPRTLINAKKCMEFYFGMTDEVHVEITRFPACVYNYCKKELQFKEIGQFRRQGHRTDLDVLHRMISTGASELEIYEENPGQYFRNYRAINRARFLYKKKSIPMIRPLHVTWIYGPAGFGKTWRAINEAPTEPFILSKGNTGVWFDGYDGEKTLIIDEMSGWIPYELLLRMLDKYKLQCDVKGGMVWAEWNHVIVTSNKHPLQVYKDEVYQRHNDGIELMRRIDELIEQEHY